MRQLAGGEIERRLRAGLAAGCPCGVHALGHGEQGVALDSHDLAGDRAPPVMEPDHTAIMAEFPPQLVPASRPAQAAETRLHERQVVRVVEAIEVGK